VEKGRVIYSPKAGSFDIELLPKLVSALGNVITIDIEHLQEEGATLRYAEANDCDWIAVAGGDGTVESVASDLVGTTLPLGIIPAGTFNNFAQSLDLSLNPLDACRVILAGNALPTDVGFANQRPFFECVGFGLDASLYSLGEEIKSGRFHKSIEFVRRAYRYQRQQFVLALDRPACDALVQEQTNESARLIRSLTRNQGSNLRLSALMLTISNGPILA
jgi:diacylglycerol kinase (ATP)